jgi:hypothetical protein
MVRVGRVRIKPPGQPPGGWDAGARWRFWQAAAPTVGTSESVGMAPIPLDGSAGFPCLGTRRGGAPTSATMRIGTRPFHVWAGGPGIIHTGQRAEPAGF